MPDIYNPLVSVIINCYNGDEYLKDAIDSVLNQEYSNWELIFWDNNSKDNSANIIKNYSEPRIIYFYADKHTSLGEARNNALLKASGEWIAFLDTDDIWHKNRISDQIYLIRFCHDSVNMIYCRAELFFEGKQNKNIKIIPKIKKLPTGDISKEIMLGNYIPFPSLLYKRKALLNIGGIPKLEFCPDYFMSIKLALISNVLAVDKVLCKYRVHEKSLTSNKKELGYVEAINIFKDFASNHDKYVNIRVHIARYFLYLLAQLRLKDAVKSIKNFSIIQLLIGILQVIKYKYKY